MERKQKSRFAAPPQIEPTPSGTLPPSFAPNTRRTVYIGNIHTQATEPLIKEVFSSTGCVEAFKLIKEKESSYGFIQYCDRRSAALAIYFFNGRRLLRQPLKVNWINASGELEDTSGPFNIFVGGLSPEVTNAMLFNCFSVYSGCSNARVIWDQKTGRSRGYGFVSFWNQQDAQSAINDLTGKWLGSRQIHCKWATKGTGTNDDKQSSDTKRVVELTTGSSGDGKEAANNDASENNPEFSTGSSEDGKLAPENNRRMTTVHVSNLAPEVTQLDLHRHFQHLGAGLVEDVWVHSNKGFGFVRYNTHFEARRAIELATRRPIVCGKPIKCTWGNKPTPPRKGLNPLPHTDPERLPDLSDIGFLSFERLLVTCDMFINEYDGCCRSHSQGQLPLEEEEEDDQEEEEEQE